MGIRSAVLRCGFLFLALVLLSQMAMPTFGQATGVSSFRISQAVSESPMIKSYLEILDDLGNQVKDVQRQQLTATVGASPAAVTDLRTFQELQEGVAYILLVDISQSLREVEFAQMRKILTGWIEGMGSKDQAAIITFGTQVKTVQDFTNNQAKLKAIVAGLKPVDDQTQVHLGVVKALELGRRLDQSLPQRRAIITLTDGQDDFAGGLTKKEVLEKIKIDPIPIYAIGFYHPPRNAVLEEALKNLGEFARTSGGTYFRAATGNFKEIYDQIHRRIRDVFVAWLTCPNCQWNGTVQNLQLDLTQGTQGMRAGLEIRLTPALPTPSSSTALPPEPSRWRAWLDKIPALQLFGLVIPGYAYLGALLGLLLVALGLFFWRRRIQEPTGVAEPIWNPDESGWGVGEDIPPPIFNTSGSTLDVTGKIPKPGQPPALATQNVPKAGRRIRLTVLRDKHETAPFELLLKDTLTIGRAKGQCDILLDKDPEVSRQHCQLMLQDGKISVVDLDSKNGTSVNGVPITGRYGLEQDDIIRVGKTELRLSVLEG